MLGEVEQVKARQRRASGNEEWTKPNEGESWRGCRPLEVGGRGRGWRYWVEEMSKEAKADAALRSSGWEGRSAAGGGPSDASRRFE